MATLIYTIGIVSISLWVGSIFNTSLFGWACFIMFLPGYKFVIAIDMAFFVYFDHHKRNDNRAKKIVESQRFITKEQTEELLRTEVWRRCSQKGDFTEYDQKYNNKKLISIL
jgi:1,4-dihydroxy-2-naphthoate octaprenyltransferase